MASQEHYDALSKAGIRLDKRLDTLDTIERATDLEQLFEALHSVKDKNGNPGVVTPFINMANPDYEQIKAADYQSYIYEPFTKTLARYGEEKAVTDLYRQGVKEGVFKPEYHGREHFTVLLWMDFLKKGDKETRIAFEHQFYSLMPTNIDPRVKGFRSTFFFEKREDMAYLKDSIKDGAKLFKDFFGFSPTVFDPPNGVFHPDMDETLAEIGILNVAAHHKRNEPDGNGGYTTAKYSFGQRNKLGQRYYIRNCQFDPWAGSDADYCLPMIAAAFRWGKPAILSNHRGAYSGGIKPANRELGVREIKKLLLAVKKQWPDVEFMSSGELAALMHQK